MKLIHNTTLYSNNTEQQQKCHGKMIHTKRQKDCTLLPFLLVLSWIMVSHFLGSVYPMTSEICIYINNIKFVNKTACMNSI